MFHAAAAKCFFSESDKSILSFSFDLYSYKSNGKSADQLFASAGSIAPATSNATNSFSAVSPVTSMGLGGLSGTTLTSLNGLAGSAATNGSSLDPLSYSSIQQYTG